MEYIEIPEFVCTVTMTELKNVHWPIMFFLVLETGIDRVDIYWEK